MKKSVWKWCYLCLVFFSLAGCGASLPGEEELAQRSFIFVTEYTGGRVSCWSYTGNDPGTARYQGALVTGGNSPNMLIAHPVLPFVYVFHKNSTEISLFEVDKSVPQGLKFRQNYNLTRGEFVAVSHDGKYLYVANWGNRFIYSYAIDPETGALSEVTGSPVEVTPTASLRDMALCPSGPFLLASNTADGGIYSFKLETDGTLTLADTAIEAAGNGLAKLAMLPSGTGVYAGYVSINQIAFYSLDPTNGTVTYIENKFSLVSHSTYPGRMAVTPDARRLICFETAGTSFLGLYTVDPANWDLSYTNRQYGMKTPDYDLSLDSSGRYLALATYDSDSIILYEIQNDRFILLGDLDIGAATSPSAVLFLP